MSEYQYYEFRAIDKPLDERAQDDLRGISSRADITATSFTNTYNWGDLRGDPAKMLARWFDAFLHVTNWGTRWLAFRIPDGVLSDDDLCPFWGEIFESRDQGEHTCLHFHLHPEDGGGDWLDGEGWLDSLLPLRDALGAGDLRCFYLAWLVDVYGGTFEDEETEPPVPPGLGELDAPHRAFAELMQVDTDLLAIAAEMSAPLVSTGPTRQATLDWLAARDREEKDAWLLRVLDGEGAGLRWELRKRLLDEAGDQLQAPHPRRTAGELLDRAEAHQNERLEREARERAERQRQEAERRAAARQKHLDGLVGQEEGLWREVDELIATRKPKSYDQVALLLADLRDLAIRAGTRAAWDERFASLRQEHSRKPSLMRRLDKVAP